jgi:hypothetical protein
MDTLTHRHPLWSEFRRRIRKAVGQHGCQHTGAYDDEQPPLAARELGHLSLDVASSLKWLEVHGTMGCDCEIAGGLTELAADRQLAEYLEAERIRREEETAEGRP